MSSFLHWVNEEEERGMYVIRWYSVDLVGFCGIWLVFRWVCGALDFFLSVCPSWTQKMKPCISTFLILFLILLNCCLAGTEKGLAELLQQRLNLRTENQQLQESLAGKTCTCCCLDQGVGVTIGCSGFGCQATCSASGFSLGSSNDCPS